MGSWMQSSISALPSGKAKVILPEFTADRADELGGNVHGLECSGTVRGKNTCGKYQGRRNLGWRLRLRKKFNASLEQG